MPKTYRIFLSLLCFTMLLASCNSRARKEEETFIKQVNTIEENPQSALSKYKKYNIRNISGLDEATTFLFQSLALFYTNDSMPDKNMLLQCSRLFQEKRRFHQQLETICLLTEIYNQENQLEPELETLEQAIDIALKHNETEWLFLLYSRLSNMYYHSLDFLEYVKYQTLANKYIQKNYDAEKLSSNEVLLIAENYLYTDHCEKALNTLQSIQLKQEHWLYGKHKFLLGVTYSKLEQWDKAINEIEACLKTSAVSDEDKLISHTTLAYCYMQLGLNEKANLHKNKAMTYKTDSLNSFTAIAIYQTLNDINRINNDKDAELRSMQKIIDQYQSIVYQLNNRTLDEAIQTYTKVKEKKAHLKRIRNHQYAIAVIVLLMMSGVIVYFYLKKKQAYKLLYLQARLNSMKNLENIKDETQQMILRDFEVGKKIALLKQQSRRENCHKILHELDKLDITKSNELISTDWEKFYQHIDITFDHFHEKLALQYSCLNEKEIQLCCMLKAGFKTNEIAAIWTQSIYSVHKYKTSVRKKIEMPSGADIIDFLNSKL